MNTCCYSAAFTFRQKGSTQITNAQAEFRYFGHKWHLVSFWWGAPRRFVNVGLDSDVARP
jgi:hypothetical protein